MIQLLVLGAALGAQAAPGHAPGPPGRFVVCPGNRRCPPRPTGLWSASPAPPANPMVDMQQGQLIGHGRRRDPGRPQILGFAAGETGLNAGAPAVLDEVARRAAAGDFEVLLEGHADARGTEAANVALAGRRAAAAADYLVARGVAAERILAISWGEAGQEAVTPPRSVVVTLRHAAEGRAP